VTFSSAFLVVKVQLTRKPHFTVAPTPSACSILNVSGELKDAEYGRCSTVTVQLVSPNLQPVKVRPLTFASTAFSLAPALVVSPDIVDVVQATFPTLDKKVAFVPETRDASIFVPEAYSDS